MAHKFYDPITEKWHTMKAPAKRAETIEDNKEGLFALATRIGRENAIWRAVVSSATASQMSTETESVEMDQDRP